jgi:hypothetical protein
MEVFGLSVLIAILAIYFLPSIVAGVREHPQSAPIILLNFFLGWTLIGWVAALVWAATAFVKRGPEEFGTNVSIAPPQHLDLSSQLAVVQNLRGRGVITDDEYQAKRRQILGL